MIGTAILTQAKGTPLHRQLGRVFVALAGVVCMSALVGTVFFRFVPVFAVLTLLVSYLVLCGWRVATTQASGPGLWDGVLTAAALAVAALLIPVLLQAELGQGSSVPVIVSTLAAVALVIFFDIAKWFFPRHWHARTWRYEHIYKMVSALSGMASAAVGNLFQTVTAQLLPSAFGTVVIAWCFWRESRRR